MGFISGFFGEFFRGLQSDPLAVICYVSDKLKLHQRFFSEDSFFEPKPNAGAFGQSLHFFNFFAIYIHRPASFLKNR